MNPPNPESTRHPFHPESRAVLSDASFWPRMLQEIKSKGSAIEVSHASAGAKPRRAQQAKNSHVPLGSKALGWARCLLRTCTNRKEASAAAFLLTVVLMLSKRKRRLRREARLISRAGLMDDAWYRAEYAHLPGAFLCPVVHYLHKGASLGCNPNALFDTKWYKRRHKASVQEQNPLVHYLKKGSAKKLRTHPYFDVNDFLTRHSAVPPEGETQLAYQLKHFGSEVLPECLANIEKDLPRYRARRRVIFVSGEPGTPGHIYRVEMYAKALAACGYDVHTIEAEAVLRSFDLLVSAALIIVWRASWRQNVEQIHEAAQKTGAKILFDVDDLMFKPELATATWIDAIRFNRLKQDSIVSHYKLIRRSALAADYCSSPTAPLTSALRGLGKPGFVLPNGFDEKTYLRTRRAVALRRAEPADGLVRIGYAGGTRTHQRDFARAVPAIARILREHPECRLVLFRVEQKDAPEVLCLDPVEYPELAGLESQIEWMLFRPLRELPDALARFDVNLAPLEHGNPFCEAKSELKYFETALAEVPTIASPTVPFATAIRHGETGFLARGPEEWYACLKELVCDPGRRLRVGKAAFHDVSWRYGPERRAELIGNAVAQILGDERQAAEAFQLELLRARHLPSPSPEIPEYEVLFEAGVRAQSRVAVVIPLYNYGHFVEEALESVKAQTLAGKDVIVVDDRSTDDSAAAARAWLERNAPAFTHAALLRNKVNSGLSLTRNAGFSFTDAPLIMALDADNRLAPECLERCQAEIDRTGAAAAYSLIEKFGDDAGFLSKEPWSPSFLAVSNYIDAMAMIRRPAWERVGGYRDATPRGGWEDYSFWCRFVEYGLWACWIPERLAFYRVHGKSMLHTATDQTEIKRRLIACFRAEHPWIDLPERVEASPEDAPVPAGS